MKHIFKILSLSFIILTGCENSSNEKEYDDYLNDRGFNGQVLITKNGEPIYQKVFGYSDIENLIETKSDDNYLIGSITKQFTSLSILILEEQGLLSTNDSIEKYYDDIPNNWPLTTIHELLSHTSGFPDFEDLSDFNISTPFSADDVIDKIKLEPFKFFGKGKFRYSNIGYVLLGGIIEKVSGITYCEFVSKNIFLQLGMNKTSCIINKNDLITSGYVKSENGFENVPFSYMTYTVGNGNLYSNINDLTKWNESINSKKLASDSVYLKWFSSNAEVQEDSEYEDKGDYLGYGWFLSFQGNTMYKTYHLGGVTGYKSCITRFPNDNILVLTLSNVEDKYSNKMRMEFPKLVYQRETRQLLK